MATKQGEGITIYFEGNTVDFDKSVDGMKKALTMLKSMTKTYMNEYKRTGDIEKYKMAIQSLAKEQEAATKKAQAWADKAAAAKIGSDEWKNALKQWSASRKELTAIQLKLAEAEEDLRRFSQPEAVQRMADAFDRLGEKMDGIRDTARVVADWMREFSRAAQQGLEAAVGSAVQFESAFASVKKTIDETSTTSYDQLQKDLRDLSKTVPTTVSELAELASLAGQMGVGADDVVSFTKAIVDFGNSTNITAEEAVQDIAQIYNVIGKGGDYSTLENLLSAIVDLGNNSATTEKDIVTMFRNIAAAGSRIGMTEQQVAALAATLASLGLDKGGASAISTLMTKIDMAVATNADSLRDWADAAGMSVSEFKAAWGEDAAGALASLLDNLKKTADEGGNLNQVFDDLNVKEMRRVDTLGRLINANDVYRQSMERADKAFEEGNALSNEANKRYATTASKIQIMKNSFMDFALSVGERLLPILNALVDFGTQIADFLASTSPAIQTLIGVVGGLVAVIAPLAAGIAFLTTKFAPLVKWLGMVIGQNGALTHVVGALSKAFSALSGPIGVILGLFALLYATNDGVRESTNTLAKTIMSTLVNAFNAIWQIARTVYELFVSVVDVVGKLWQMFMDTTAGKVFVGVFEVIIDTVNWVIGLLDKLLGLVARLFGGLADSVREARQLDDTLSPGYGRKSQYINAGLTQSGGYMSDGMMATGMTFNNTFTITGVNNIDQATANRLADMMTNRINENLGRRYA